MDALFFAPEEDKTTGPVQEAVSGLFLSIACVLVSLRLYVRARMIKKLWWDDCFLLLGLVRTLTICACRGLIVRSWAASPRSVSAMLASALGSGVMSII